MILDIEREQLPFCCGIQEFGGFGWYKSWYDENDKNVLPGPGDCNLGSAGLACAAFINTTDCRKAYEFLADQHTILFQSTVRKNYNSGRDLFFVVYGKKG